MNGFKDINTADRIMQEAKRLRGEVLSMTKLPGDDFLYLVLVEREDDWVTWWWNDETEGFASGHYHHHLHHAVKDYIDRIHSGLGRMQKA